MYSFVSLCIHNDCSYLTSVCSCLSTLCYALFFFLCIDINECFYQDACGTGNTCINTEGSYVCACDKAGYYYVRQENSCIGKNTSRMLQTLNTIIVRINMCQTLMNVFLIIIVTGMLPV